MRVSIRSDTCLALRLIATQEHYRKTQDWLAMLPELQQRTSIIVQSQSIIETQADEILRLRAENEKLRAATTPICVGRRIIGILAKEGAWTSEDGASVIAADELFQRDPYEENEKLRAALKPFAEYEYDDMDDDKDEIASPFILFKHIRAAAAALKETGDE